MCSSDLMYGYPQEWIRALGKRIVKFHLKDFDTKTRQFVALGEGRFEPRAVKAGDIAGDLLEVIGGVRAGEQVVVRASFLVDSESQLKAALAAKP